MRLAAFILANLDSILQAWEDFARTLPAGSRMTVLALRNDAERMLRFIAHDMETRQSSREQFLKSVGAGPQPAIDQPSAAQDHGVARALDRFTLADLVSEYRALRASVLSLWLADSGPQPDPSQIIRFNEAIDQLIAESVERYSGELERDADVFTASIGHDLRNPLNAIAMCARILDTSSKLSPDERRAVRQIAVSTLRMGNMLGELQDFSRVRLGGLLSFEREPVEVAALCEQIVQEVRASSPACPVSVTQEGDTWATVSRERVAQLVSNLVGNAVQYSPPGEAVDVAVRGGDRDVCIDVHNAGRAIPAAVLAHVFEPLYRGEDSVQEPRTHLGLGLHIARTIAVAHGGDITVDSSEGAGTTFRVRLPRRADGSP